MAKSEKNSFLLYKDSKEVVGLLSDEQAGVLLKAIFEFVDEQELPEMDQLTNMAFTTIRTYLERDSLKYEETCRRRAEAGKLGGRPKANKPNGFLENQMKPKEPEYEYEYESERDKKKKSTPQKHKYGSQNNVLLTDQELEKLKAEYSDYEARIEELSLGIALKGYKYKSHYLAIKKWAKNDLQGQKGVNKYGNNPEQSNGYSSEDVFGMS